MGWEKINVSINTPGDMPAKCDTGCVYKINAAYPGATKCRVHFTAFNLTSPDIYFDFTTSTTSPGSSSYSAGWYSYTGPVYWYV